MPGLEQPVDDGSGLSSCIQLLLLLGELRLELLQLGQLLLEVSALHLRLLPLDLHLFGGAAALRADLQHVHADAVVHYINS